jgi:DNA-binding FadR family transcriptional regulator
MPRLVATDIAVALRKRISSGEWADLGRMPPERDLASEFGVARNTIRRAVSLLAEDGTVTRQTGRGTFLQMEQKDSLSQAIARMEGASPADMMEIRLLLEPSAAQFAATNASISELHLVRDAHQMATDSADMPDFEHWDAEFHNRIFACSRNDFLKEIHNVMRILRNQPPWFEMKKRSFSEERRQRYCGEHAAIVEALMQRNPDGARAAMLAHLQTVEKNLLGR